MANNQQTHDDLKIIELNVRSLIALTRRQDLTNFLQINKPDIMLLCETNITHHHNINFNNYNFIRTDREPDTYIRGTGILIASKYAYQQIDTRCWGLTSLECTAIQISTESQQINFISLYRNPSDNSNYTFTEDLSKIHRALNNNGSIVIGGDFNAKHRLWKNTSECVHGTRLYDWLIQNALPLNVKLESTNEPTFYRGRHRSFLDLFIISEQLNTKYADPTINALDIIDYNSDHRAVQLVLQLNGRPIKAEKQTFINFSQANWSLLKKEIERDIQFAPIFNNRNMTTNEIDSAIDSLTTTISSAVKKAIPKTEVRRNCLITLKPELIDLIAHKNRLRRQWQRNKYNYNAHLLKSEIKNIEKIISDQVIIAHSQHWTKTLQAIKLDNNTFKNINKLTARNLKSNIPTLTEGNNNYTTDEEKANILASQFKRAHETTSATNSVQQTQINNSIRQELLNNHTPRTIFSVENPANPERHFNHLIHATSIPNLKSIIKNRNNKKSAGFDEIPNTVLRKIGNNCITALATIINQSYNIGYFPNVWKNAKVIAIAKKCKPPTDPNNYRPIALLSCISKIYECIIHDKLKDQCEDTQILPDDQFGFRARRTTTHALVKFQQDIVNEFTKRAPTIAITIDIAKAFDTVWPEGLIHKMMNIYHMDAHLCRLIFNFLTNRSFSVNVKKAVSPNQTIAAGVPQGSVISATLYIIYVADLPLPPPYYNKINRLQFADDILIYTSTRDLFVAKNRIESYIETLQTYLAKWKLKCNEAKCEVIIFKSQRRFNCNSVNRSYRTTDIKIGNNFILPQNTIKYLGIIFQRDALHTKHIDHTIKKARAATFALYPIIRKITGLDKKIRMLCYKQLIRPIIAYGFPCWTNISSHQMERLRILERKTLRLCTQYRRERNKIHINNSQLYHNANIIRIDNHLTQQALKFFDKCAEDHQPPIIHSLVNEFPTESFLFSNKYKPPDMLMRLNAAGHLYNGETLIYYHRKYSGAEGTVYNIKQ